MWHTPGNYILGRIFRNFIQKTEKATTVLFQILLYWKAPTAQ